MTRLSRAGRAGFSLIEVLVALLLLGIMVGPSISFFRRQVRGFNQGATDADVGATQRLALTTFERMTRALGAGQVGDQPMLVYGSDSTFAFNGDYWEYDSTTQYRFAIALNPNVDSSLTRAWPKALSGTIPGTTYTYPWDDFIDQPGEMARAETIIMWFERDTSTTDANDFVMKLRMNNGPSEIIARNIYRQGSTPFFQYLMRKSNVDSLYIASGSQLPLIRKTLDSAATAADTAKFLLPDSAEAVRLNIRVSNGLTGTAQRLRDVSTVAFIPNNGIFINNICGRSPFPVTTFTATADTTPGSGQVTLAWNAAPDDNAGEQDLLQYVIFRRPDTASAFSSVLQSVKAKKQASYTVVVGNNTPGQAWRFGIAAQDCTPNNSSLKLSNAVTPP